jgi:OmpA-OmpF porin, OOP family
MKTGYSTFLAMTATALWATFMPVVASEKEDRIAPSPGISGSREKSFELNPFAGYNFFEKKQNLKDRLVYGGRLGFNFSRHFGIEGTLEFINTYIDDKTRIGAEEGQFRSPMNRVNLAFYHVDALYHFMPESRLTPFIVAGLGGAHYNPKISNHDMSTFDLGAGAKYWMADHIAFRLDLRDNLVTEVFPFRKSYHNLQASAGIVFSFGGKSRAGQTAAGKTETKSVEKEIVLVSEVPEPQVEEKVKVLASEQKIIVLAFEDVHFDLDKSTLTEEARTILKRSVQILKNNSKSKIRIAGYTSASGTKEYNQNLSEKRANAVEKYLIDEGVIPQNRLSTIGYGETRPAEHEAAPKNLYSKAAKANMRVLFEIIIK